jgi:hypothetical protein
MSAADLIRRAGEAGIILTAGQDGRLQLSADRQPAAELLAELVAHKVEIIAALRAVNDPQQPRAWLHLLTLNNGGVIQHCGDTDTAAAEQAARLLYGGSFQGVVPVPGFERPLSEGAIVKALAGTLGAPSPIPESSNIWLSRVARLLGVRPGMLLDGGHLERHDLTELAGTDPEQVADTIQRSPAWVERLAPAEQHQILTVEQSDDEPPHAACRTAMAPPEWREIRDQYMGHLMICCTCYAPTGRFCAVGTKLRQRYDCTPMERQDD